MACGEQDQQDELPEALILFFAKDPEIEVDDITPDNPEEMDLAIHLDSIRQMQVPTDRRRIGCHRVKHMPSPPALQWVCFPHWFSLPPNPSPPLWPSPVGAWWAWSSPPDLDVRDRDTHAETIMRRAGSCLGAIWNLFWLPYSWLISRHRHLLSHWPIIGTALRLVYMLALPAILWWGLGQIFPLPTLPQLVLTPLTWWAVGGLAFVDALHWGMDGFL